MEIITTRVDIAKTRAAMAGAEFFPAHIFPRNKDVAAWQILDAPYELEKPLSVAVSAADAYIRIPLFAYKLSPAGDVSLSFMFQLGAALIDQINNRVKKLHIVIGNPVELIYNDRTLTHMNCWLGVAFVVE